MEKFLLSCTNDTKTEYNFSINELQLGNSDEGREENFDERFTPIVTAVANLLSAILKDIYKKDLTSTRFSLKAALWSSFLESKMKVLALLLAVTLPQAYSQGT